VVLDTSKNTSESRVGNNGNGGGAGVVGNPLLTLVDDKFTRNDIFYNPAPPSHINTAPVIPTSSQYGLAIVSEAGGGGGGGGGGGIQSGEVTPTPAVAITNPEINPLNLDKAEAEREIVHNRYERMSNRELYQMSS